MSNNKDGMKIVHDYDELEEGYNYTMVLKDAPLIDPNTNTLAEGNDELESMEIIQGSKKKGGRLSQDPYLKVFEEESKGVNDKPGVILSITLRLVLSWMKLVNMILIKLLLWRQSKRS